MRSISGRCEWPKTTDLAVREACRAAAGRARRRPGVVHHPDPHAAGLDDSLVRQPRRQIVVVAVAEHAPATGPSSSQLDQHRQRRRSRRRAGSGRPREHSSQQARRQLPPAARQVRVRHDRDAHHAPVRRRGRRRPARSPAGSRDVVQPQHRDAGAGRQRRGRRRAAQVVLLGSPLASAVNSLCEQATSTGKPSASTRSRSRRSVRSSRVDLPNPKPGSTRIALLHARPRPCACAAAPRVAQHLVDGALVRPRRVRARPAPVVRDHEAAPRPRRPRRPASGSNPPV